MGRGANLSEVQIERIKQVFADIGSVRGTARTVGLPVSTVAPHCKRTDEYEQIRTEKRAAIVATIAEELAEVQRLYLAHLKEPGVIAGTSAKDSMIVVGTAVDKEQLITGKPTERTEHVNADDARAELARRTDELAKRRQARTDRESERSGS
jgi:hypothetical protein